MADIGALTDTPAVLMSGIGTVPDMTAAEMLRQKLCTAVCLLAVVATDSCTCPCLGDWHGVLAEVRVPDSAASRTEAPPPRPEPERLFELEAAMT